MNQSDIDRAVAHATGETVSTIRRLGFRVERFQPDDAFADVEDGEALVVDWDVIGELGQSATDPGISLDSILA